MQNILPGQIILHYRIEEELGSGGMGIVYRAIDTKLDRKVALKFLPPVLTRDKDSKQRFIREAKTASGLQDNNICTIHNIEESEDGQLFIVMDCYEGESLKDKILRGPLEKCEVVDVITQIANGLKKAHTRGIVHRDIKPANIFITIDGTVKLLDFGLAKASGRTQLTQLGSTVGTCNYMSPEQAKGEEVDKGTDIWSLGIVMYEMLTGGLPFTADYDQAIIYSILNENPDLSYIPPTLLPVIRKMLAKDRLQRYQDVDEIITELKSLLTGDTSKGENKLSLTSTNNIQPKTKILLVLIFVIAIVLLVINYLVKGGSGDNSNISQNKTKMIVVLPFENLGSPEDEYLADGVRDEISNKLSSITSVGVISRNSAEKYAKSNKSTKQIGEELGVDYILEGTIRWAKGNEKESRIRIIPQLVRVSDDVSIWSESFDKVIKNIFNVQNEIAQNVVDKLGIKLLPGQSMKGPPPTKNLEAYDYYLKAYRFQYNTSSNSDLLTAIELYKKAIALDPDFALAHAQIGLAYMAIYVFYVDRNIKNLDKASQHIEKAKELNPELPELHFNKGFYYGMVKNDEQSALEEFKKTIEMQPSNSEAYFWLGGIYADRGDLKTGIEYQIKASLLDPLTERYLWGIGIEYFRSRDYQNAEKYYKKAIEINPGYGGYYACLAYNYLAWRGDIYKAEETMSKTKDDSYLEVSKNLLIYSSILKRNFDKALYQLKSSQKAYDSSTEFVPNSQMIAFIYKYKNEIELSKKYFKASLVDINKRLKIDPKDKRLYNSLSISYAGLGNNAKVLVEFGRFMNVKEEEIQKNSDRIRSNYSPEICILLGEYDDALKQIEYLLSKPTGFSINILKLDPLYDPLRNLPGYKALIKKYSKRS